MSKQVTPNRLQQATQELSKRDLGAFKIPNKIQSGEAGDYVVICVKSRDNAAGTDKIHEARLCYASVSKWNEMAKELASGRVKGMFLGMFQIEVILHNPTLPLVKEKKPSNKVKGLSPSQKKLVNAMMEEGKGEDDEGLKNIAEAAGVSFDRVKAYTQSF